MTVSVVQSWSFGQVIPFSSAVPPPTVQSFGLNIVPQSQGNWLVACVAWRCLIDFSGATMCVADDVHNWWEPACAGQSTSTANGVTRTAIWMAPAAVAPSTVYFAPTDPIRAITATVYEVTGMTPWVQTTAITNYAANVTTLSTVLPAPPASSIIFTAEAINSNATGSVTLTAGGWGAVTQWGVTNGVNTSSDLAISSAFQVSSGSVTAQWNWTGAGTVDEAVAIAAFVAAPAALTPRSPHWPVTIIEAAPGAGFQTPPDQLFWTPLTTSYLRLSFNQGRQYETAQLQAGEGTILMDSPTGEFLPILNTENWQVQWHGNGTNTFSGASTTGLTFNVTAGQLYNFAAWLGASAAWSGMYCFLDWQGGGGHISTTNGSQVSAVPGKAFLSVVSDFAPTGATHVFFGLSAGAGVLPTTTTLSAMAAFPASATGTAIAPPSTGVTWASVGSSTITLQTGWVSVLGLDTGTPIRLRTAWQGGTWQVTFHSDGAHAFPYVTTGFIFNVLGSTSYPVAAVFTVSQDVAGVLISVDWQDSGHGSLGTTSITSVAVAAGQVIVVSGNLTSPVGAAFAEVDMKVSGTPAAGNIIQVAASLGTGLLTPPAGFTAWSPSAGTTITATAPWASDVNGAPDPTPWYMPFSGFVERLPQQWDAQLRGFTEMSVTDSWFAVNFQPQPILPTEILNDNPHSYWPLTDLAGQNTGSNLAPGNTIPMTLVGSKYGAGGAKASFGQNTGAIFGAQSSFIVEARFVLSQQAGMWGDILGSTTQDQQMGFALQALDTTLPSSAGGYTIEFWFQAAPPLPNNYSPALLGIGNPAAGSNSDFWAIQNSSTGGVPVGQLFISGSFATLQNIGSVNWTPSSNPPLGFVAITFNQASYTIWVNGVSTASANWTANLPTFNTITVGGIPLFFDPGSGFFISSWGGFLGHVAVFPYILTPERINTHYQAGLTGLAGEPSTYRIERLLQAGDFLGPRIIQAESATSTTNVASCQDVGSQPAGASIMNITQDLQPGMFFVAPNGNLVMLPKSSAWNQKIKWKLGDSPADGEFPYEPDIAFDYDPTRIQNEIQISQLDNQDVIIPSVTAIENASQAQYGTVTNIATGYLEGDANVALNYGPGLYDLANYLAVSYDSPLLRVSKATFSSAATPSSWPLILGAAVADMTTLTRRPPGAGVSPLIQLNGRITQTSRTFEFSVGSTTAELSLVIDSAPEEFALICDDSVRGQLNGTNILGW